MKTQNERLLNWLESGLSITRLEGWDKLGIIELPARISELKFKGHAIITDRVTVRNRYGEAVSVAKWSLPGEEPF